MKTFLATVFAILLFGAGVLLAPRLQPWLSLLGHPAAATATPPTVATDPALSERKPVKYRHRHRHHRHHLRHLQIYHHLCDRANRRFSNRRP